MQITGQSRSSMLSKLAMVFSIALLRSNSCCLSFSFSAPLVFLLTSFLGSLAAVSAGDCSGASLYLEPSGLSSLSSFFCEWARSRCNTTIPWEEGDRS